MEQLENRPIKVRSKAEQDVIIRSLTGPEREMLLALRPFMQKSPYLVQSDASLSRAYRLFRTMGLRHMFVSQPQPKVSFLHHRDYIRYWINAPTLPTPFAYVLTHHSLRSKVGCHALYQSLVVPRLHLVCTTALLSAVPAPHQGFQ